MEKKMVNILNGIQNGKKALKAKFINGNPDGTYREWHENGKKALKIKYIDGLKMERGNSGIQMEEKK